MYREGIVSVGKARDLSVLSRREFHSLLGEREVDRHYTAAELDENLDYARR